MAIKLVDELKAMGSFPIAHAEGINLVKTDGTEDNLQNLFDNGELGGGDDSVTLTQEEYNVLPEEQKLDGLYYTYDTKRIYKNGIQYGASEPIPLTMEEYKALKEAGAIDEQQEYLIEANTEGILLEASDIGYSNAVSNLPCTTVQGAIDKVNANLGELSELKTTEKSNLVGAINEVVGNIETSYQILTPLFSEETGNKVVLYKFGKLRMISPMCILPASRPIMTYFDAYQLPEDSYPSNKIWYIMPTIANTYVDLTIDEGGKIQIRYRNEANHAWIPSLFWVVD